jgi:hypothetical protein
MLSSRPAFRERLSVTNMSVTNQSMTNKSVLLIIVALVCVLLQSCGGSSNGSNFQSSTTTNPAPGISLVAISIAPATGLIAIGESRQLIATGTYNDGSQQILGSQVTWRSNSGSAADNVAVNTSGLATGRSLGSSVVTASVGPVVGVLQLIVDTNGYSSNSIAVMSVPFKNSMVDAVYLPQSQAKTEGAYAVQEVNLDADAFSNVLPVPDALLASVPMPAGYVPNATIGYQSGALVAVISYTSPKVLVIDASNVSTDVASNTVVDSFSAPVTKSATINGTTCMICAGVVDPQTGKLVLSTAQGYYSMDLVSGAFTQIPFTPAPAPALNFTLNPAATNPYILNADPGAGQIQILNLSTNVVTAVNSGITTPVASAIDLATDYAAVVDGATNNISLVNLVSPEIPVITPVFGVGICGTPNVLNMAAMAVVQSLNGPGGGTLFTSQTGGSCTGYQTWPTANSIALDPTNIIYWYGPMPPTPDGKDFANGTDPNAITTFNDVRGANDYGVLVDANQQWIARVNLAFVNSLNQPLFLPGGALIPPENLCTGVFECPNSVVYFPSPNTAITVSVNNISFGSDAVGTQTAAVPVTLANIGQQQLFPVIAIQGANASDFSIFTSSCTDTLLMQTSCGINIVFAPTATGARSATLNITTQGEGTLSVALSGTGT